MRRKIPSNSALLAFEASARHGSFARAADELALTEGAISRQIARLEAFLGVTLFERVGNRVRLLPNGARYAIQVRETLDRLERDSQYLMGQRIDGASLDIATIPTFATRWLIPHLPRFQDMHPNIIVHLTERMEPFVLAGSGFDAAIHFEHPAWTGMRTHRLLHETLVPVCHPRLIEGQGSVSLDELPRLHRRQNPDAWQRYAEETGLVLTNPAIGARYDLHSMQIEAALAGLGVALVPRLYIETELTQGRLIAPWPDGTSISKTFCLVLPEPIRLSEGPIQAFANWLIKEARAAQPALLTPTALPRSARTPTAGQSRDPASAG
ncbi:MULTISPECIES: LysR substrate-binding domain-containing protein [unclassified Rhizobium]|uniref:LysR substrate-binding domain-containing protein n=1 Tax=unclassified Rhizobium TaxID=2613769 RepID=UPI001ADC12E6|nr:MULTISPECIES: LysR substrate-binding domain-containing protein [unclassified Rhizobium]MBO9123003.1 LysR family transcriptional regulator [Rhizobium sp. 16-488-2b]MBO9173535.1 LysR family transcriptional regulator [Rhizobium sp. 16-488-2a]